MAAKRPVPEWQVQLVWFLASVFATGAVWYFLSRNETAIAAVSGVAAITLAGVAVQLHRLNDRHTRFRVHRENMARFLADAQELLQASSGRRITPQEYSSWVSRAKTYLAEHLDSSYVARFGDFSGMTFSRARGKNVMRLMGIVVGSTSSSESSQSDA
jgi:hypothetical protein